MVFLIHLYLMKKSNNTTCLYCPQHHHRENNRPGESVKSDLHYKIARSKKYMWNMQYFRYTQLRGTFRSLEFHPIRSAACIFNSDCVARPSRRVEFARILGERARCRSCSRYDVARDVCWHCRSHLR